MMFHDLDQLVYEIQQDHADRLDEPSSNPLVPRPYKPRPRPKTAIISEAAKNAQWAEELD